MNVSVILIESETSGNLGAIARLIANFEAKELILINPQTKHLNDEALHRAKHAKQILKDARVIPYGGLEALKEEFDLLIATTSITGTDYNLPRLPVTPMQLPELISGKKVAIVFGREGSGLKNEEIKMCDISVTIPSSDNYTALNLSHAVCAVLSAIFSISENHQISKITPASRKELEVISGRFDDIFDSIEFSTEEQKQSQKIVWQRIMAKSNMTRREAFAVLGLLKKVLYSLKDQ